MTTQRVFDVIVVGLGAFGSSAVHHLAKLGARVLGVEQYSQAGHRHGSSHGHSRIIRLAYREGSEYVPLLRRSYNLFLELQGLAHEQLFQRTGMLDVGPGVLHNNSTLSSAKDWGLEYELLVGEQVNKRFPGYNIPPHWPAVYQPDGGVLAPEKILQAHCKLAAGAGATLLWNTRVAGWKTSSGGGVSVSTCDGTVYHGGQLVLAAGPWMADLIPRAEVGAAETAEDQHSVPVTDHSLLSGATSGAASASQDCSPSLEVSTPTSQPKQQLSGSWYGFPEWGPQPGFKIGLYNHLNEVVHPDKVSRHITPQDEEALRVAVRQYFPAANGPLLAASTCMFTNTPDGHFIIDRHPVHSQVIICSACSGHGFKMSSGVGQLMARAAAAWPGPSQPGGQHLQDDAGDCAKEMGFARFSKDRPGHAEFLHKT